MDDFNRILMALREMAWHTVLAAVFDVLLVSYLLYRLLMLVRGTRAWRILGGILIFLVAMFLSDRIGLSTLHWILEKAAVLGPVALVILLLPEMRQAIESLGKIGFWPQRFAAGVQERAEARTVEELVAAMAELASQRVGALVVIEMDGKLEEIASNGVQLNAAVSAPLLGSIFYDNNPLHDGAVIVTGDTLLAAACRLPLSESSRLDQNVHMRHRAAVGVSELHDCLAIVVSEERGTISVAREGRLVRLSSAGELRELLNKELRDEGKVEPKRSRIRKRHETEAPAK